MIRYRLPLTFALAFAAVACARVSTGDAATPPGVHAGGPADEYERAVARRILKTVDNPDSVEWIAWGPHDYSGLTHYHDPAEYKVVRVRWRYKPKDGPPTTADVIYAVGKGLATTAIPQRNFDGAGWLEKARAAKARGRPSQ